MILVDELAATGHSLAAGAATQPRLVNRPVPKILIRVQPRLNAQIVQLSTELPVRKLSDQGPPK
jgi:hypothetical protein